MPEQHALLSASGAHRWLHCTPSARLEQLENTEECSVYAAEGTAAHVLAELKLSYTFGKIPYSVYQQKYEEFKTSDEYGQYYNREFEEYVDSHVNYIKTLTDSYEHFDIYFEVRVNFSNVVPQGFGTADVLIVTEDTIHIVDLKFGAGVPVSAIENPQLRLYAMGALNLFPNSKYIKATINQPRLDNQDTECLTKETLLKWAFEYVKPRADEAVRGEGEFNASEDACRFCKLRGKCKARADAQLQAARDEFAEAGQLVEMSKTYKAAVTETPVIAALTPEQLGNILDMAPKFVEWFKDVQAYALGQLVAGENIPGYKLVEGRSNRIITDEKAVKDILLSIGLREEQIMKPQEMLGISKLEALVGKKVFAEICADYLIKPQGKLTLAPLSDRRPGLNKLAMAQAEFAEPIKVENID